MSRLVAVDLEALPTPATPTIRRAVLFGVLGLLAFVNYLDFVGVLGLGWTNNVVGWVAALWTAFVVALLGSREELRERVSDVGALLVVVFGAIIVGFATAPDMGATYWYHETAVGQLTWATAPAVGNAAVVLVGWYLLLAVHEWLSEYRYLRRTTPEERILREEEP